ncbi:hypothetical protein XAXN_00520 [Xanthomonas axonopodis]|uniref:Uncharacterized protein n=1 Tax=Xanthomonas axonopodis TaxID=53413 RepID=A0A0P6VUW2_9XANT|nr:hypothetical protein XAXN_00520 [Xanthomonas axonopodis]
MTAIGQKQSELRPVGSFIAADAPACMQDQGPLEVARRRWGAFRGTNAQLQRLVVTRTALQVLLAQTTRTTCTVRPTCSSGEADLANLLGH